MKRGPTAYLLTAALFVSGGTWAQVEPDQPQQPEQHPSTPFFQGPETAPDELLDMKDMTCGKYSEMPEEGKSMLTLWADGYLSGLTGDARMSTAWLSELAAGIQQACNSNPEAGVVATVEALVLGVAPGQPMMPGARAPREGSVPGF